jgi:hypothetical protein
MGYLPRVKKFHNKWALSDNKYLQAPSETVKFERK